MADRFQRWCGICFCWRLVAPREGRCAVCSNAHMTGTRLPAQPHQLQLERYSASRAGVNA